MIKTPSIIKMAKKNNNKTPQILHRKPNNVLEKTMAKDQHILFISKIHTSNFNSTFVFSLCVNTSTYMGSHRIMWTNTIDTIPWATKHPWAQNHHCTIPKV